MKFKIEENPHAQEPNMCTITKTVEKESGKNISKSKN